MTVPDGRTVRACRAGHVWQEFSHIAFLALARLQA